MTVRRALFQFCLPLMVGMAVHAQTNGPDPGVPGFRDFENASPDGALSIHHKVYMAAFGDTWRVDHVMGKFVAPGAGGALEADIKRLRLTVAPSDLGPPRVSTVPLRDGDLSLTFVVLSCRSDGCVGLEQVGAFLGPLDDPDLAPPGLGGGQSGMRRDNFVLPISDPATANAVAAKLRALQAGGG